MSGVAPDLAAQAQCRREAAANLGQWRDVLFALAKTLPQDIGTRPVREVLEELQQKKDSKFLGLLEALNGDEVKKACDVNNDEAVRWKEHGNKAYGSGKFEECVLMYTRGMMYASEDESLAMLICNRGAALMAQEQFVEALADAHATFTLTPDYWKALQRRGACLKRLGFEVEGEKDIDAANNADVGSANAAEVVTKILHAGDGSGCSTVSPGTDVIPYLDGISYGAGVKGVVAKKRLEPGEVITETPVAHALYDDHWGLRCCYCLRRTRALYPATAYRAKGKVARGLFCSEVCGNTSWERYGQYESGNSFFQMCPVDALVASRMLRCEQAGPTPVPLRGDFTGELYPASVIGGYETLVSLCALLLGAVSAEDADRLRLAQRQVLLSGFEIRFFTGSQITINPEKMEAFIDESRPIAIGKAVCMTAARFRHSCVPNCFASFVGNPLECSLTLTIRAIKPILPEEELNIAYYNMTTYKAVSAHTRRRALVERCGFVCNCPACLDNKDERVTVDKKEYYIQSSDLYQKGCRLIREGQCDVAVNVLTQSYTIAMEHLCPPPQPPQSMIPKTHMALAKAFNRLKENTKCVEHLKAKVELDERLYGEDHIEFVDDYIRLAFFESTEEGRRMYAEKAVEMLTRFYAPSNQLSAQIKRVQSFVLRSHS